MTKTKKTSQLGIETAIRDRGSPVRTGEPGDCLVCSSNQKVAPILSKRLENDRGSLVHTGEPATVSSIRDPSLSKSKKSLRAIETTQK